MGVTYSQELADLAGHVILEADQYPTLDLKGRTGVTDYIDFITMKDLGDNSIMKGVDRFRRNFVVMKLYIDGRIILQTVFQRYSDNLSEWRGCGNFTPSPLLFDSTVSIEEPHFNFILSVLRGETVNLTEENSSYNYHSLIGAPVFVYNKNQIDACNIIQRNWRLCRYDPSYNMCHVIQFRNLLDTYQEENGDTEGLINDSDPYTVKLIKTMKI